MDNSRGPLVYSFCHFINIKCQNNIYIVGIVGRIELFQIMRNIIGYYMDQRDVVEEMEGMEVFGYLA